MPDHYPTVVVLCEDRAHYRLARGFLMQRGFDGRKIRPHQAPAGGGDAKAYVRDQYPVELRGLRSGHVRLALVVVMDADNVSVEERKKFLESDAQRKSKEPVAHIVPKWQVENWLYYLDTGTVDESQHGPGLSRYPKSTTNYDPFAKRLHGLAADWHNGLPENGIPPSLRDACHEWIRFKTVLGIP